MANEQFQNESNAPYREGSASNGGSNAAKKAGAAIQEKTDQLKEQAKSWGQEWNGRIDVAREKTSETLRTASSKIDNMATYLQEHDTRDMMDSVQQVIRQHPGKSLVIGLGLGMLIGRAFR